MQFTMMKHLHTCRQCMAYTMRETCPRCNAPTERAIPPKWSPEDKYAKYRRIIKKEKRGAQHAT